MSAVVIPFPDCRCPEEPDATGNLLGLAEHQLPVLRVAGDILDQSNQVFARKVARMVAIDETGTLQETEQALALCADAYALVAEAVSTARDRLRDALADCTGPPPAA